MIPEGDLQRLVELHEECGCELGRTALLNGAALYLAFMIAWPAAPPNGVVANALAGILALLLAAAMGKATGKGRAVLTRNRLLREWAAKGIIASEQQLGEHPWLSNAVKRTASARASPPPLMKGE